MKGLMSGAAVGALLLTMTPISAAATDGSDTVSADSIETVVVSGYRKSLDEARQLKKDSDIIADSIVAEDMAKFPDLNLAESLQRLPGVAIRREAGEGRQISLRGLGADYTRVQLNGMEALGTDDSAMDSRGQRSRDRSFDFNIFASELFSKASVEKSYQAAQSEGGMAGTVDLYTAKPFDFEPGMKGAVALKAGTNSYTKDMQPRGAVMFGYNWNDKFGILVSASYSKRKTEEQGYNDYYGYDYDADQVAEVMTTNERGTGLDISGLSEAKAAQFTAGGIWLMDGNRLSVWDSKQDRLGITAAVQWRPVENITLTLDALHGMMHKAREEYHLATRPTSQSDRGEVAINHGGTLNDIEFDSHGFAYYTDTSGTIFGSEHRRERNTSYIDQLVLSGEWDVTDRLKVDGHAGMEVSIYRTPIDDKLYMQAEGGLIAEYSADGKSAHNTYVGWDPADPSEWGLNEIYFRQSQQYTRFSDAAMNTSYKVNEALTLKVGYTYRKYKTGGYELFNDGLYSDTLNMTSVADTGTYYVFKNYNGQSWVTGDWSKTLSYYGLSHTMYMEDGDYTTDGSSFGVTEETNAGYVQANWDFEVLGYPVRGNAGVRGYETNTLSFGTVQNSDGDRVLESVPTSYSGFLPTFNASVELADGFLVRAAVSQNINRPTLTSMAMTGSVSSDSGKITVSNGNPYLKPYTTTNYDLSAEWYFGKVGMLAVGIFHKDIDNLVITETLTNVAYSTTGLSTDLASGLTEDTTVSEYSRPVNVNKAGLSGIEFAGQTDFFFLPEPFNHFGVVANLTLMTSHMPYEGLSGPIVGFSSASANGTLYYETEKWGARMSVNYRSGYQLERYNGSYEASQDGMNASVYFDASAFYNLSDSLSVTFDAINLFDTKEVQYNSIYHRLHNETKSGTTAMLGLSYKF